MRLAGEAARAQRRRAACSARAGVAGVAMACAHVDAETSTRQSSDRRNSFSGVEAHSASSPPKQAASAWYEALAAERPSAAGRIAARRLAACPAASRSAPGQTAETRTSNAALASSEPNVSAQSAGVNGSNMR
jgi:hypothetical protein